MKEIITFFPIGTVLILISTAIYSTFSFIKLQKSSLEKEEETKKNLSQIHNNFGLFTILVSVAFTFLWLILGESKNKMPLYLDSGSLFTLFIGSFIAAITFIYFVFGVTLIFSLGLKMKFFLKRGSLYLLPLIILVIIYYISSWFLHWFAITFFPRM